MAGVLRGGIYWADLQPTRGEEQAGRRPVLVLSHDLFNDRSGTVIAVALTSRPQRAGFPLTLQLPDLGLEKPSWVKIGQMRTLSVERLGAYVASVQPGVVDRVVEGLMDLVGA